MDKDDGFVTGHPVRRAIIQEVHAGETDVARITKKHRLVRPAVDRAIEELVERELLTHKDGSVALTEHGEVVSEEVARLGRNG